MWVRVFRSMLRADRAADRSLRLMRSDPCTLIVAPDVGGSAIETDPRDASVVYMRGREDYERKVQPILHQLLTKTSF